MGLRKMEKRCSNSTCKSKQNNNIINSFVLCFLKPLICSLFFLSSFWIIPSLQPSSTLLSLLLSSLSQTTNYSTIFPSPTCVFILGNLIVLLLLMGESKILSSKTNSDPLANDGSFRDSSIGEGDDEKRALESCDDEDERDGEWEMDLGNSEELSKRADDFIARVNLQREIEATMLTYCCEWTTMKKRFRLSKRKCLIESF